MNQGNYGYPPQGPPPFQQGGQQYQQGGYGQPPPGPPPQGYGHHAPPPSGYPPPGYPPQGYPPQGPPPQGFPPQGFPPQGPPPQQYGQQQYGQQQFGQQQYGQQQQFNQQQYGHNQHAPPPAGPPTPASPGYDPNVRAREDMIAEADAARKAMKGFGTDEAALIRVLALQDPLKMAALRQAFAQRNKGRDLEKDVKSETGSYFGEGCVALVQGPLMHDVNLLREAIKGMGTDEAVLNDVLIGRSNADMRAIKKEFQATYKTSLESSLRSDLSMKTEKYFDMIVAANRNEESAPIIESEIERDTNELHRAMAGRVGTDEIMVCSILSNRSDGQIRAISQKFQQKFATPLDTAVDKEFSGHMKQALLLAVRRATDRAMTDAVQLEETMAGMGTKDRMLVNRVVRVHWNAAHKDQVKRAYKHKYKQELINRVKGETSGDFEKLLVAMLS